ncbi:GNAT family N-acetyltransferase [Flavobacteriaceae bacterium]|nr:GNAT family N-acetyltransferase [Flavobacteriaceae bacterium]
MEDLRVERYNEASKTAWDDFVSRLEAHSILFYRDFMDYHKDRFEDYSLMVFQGKKLIAILPANIDKEGIVHSHQGLSYGGLLFKPNSSFKLRLAQFAAVMRFLSSNAIKELFFKNIPSCYRTDNSDMLVFDWAEAELHRTDIYSYVPKGSYTVPNRNRSRQLEKAKSQGFEVRKTASFDEFWNCILTPNLKNRYTVNPVHTLEEIEYLSKKFENELLLYGVYQKDKMRAGIVLFIHRGVVHAQYSAGDDNRDDGSLDFLLDHVIKKHNPNKVFSFGTSSENQGSLINSGLLYWKESFKVSNDVQSFHVVKTKNYDLLENRLR